MNINILRSSLFGIAGGQEVDRNFSEIYIKTLVSEVSDYVGIIFKLKSFLPKYI